MIEGIALVLLVLILFLGLGNYRSAFVVAAVVPLSLLGAFTLLDLRGIPANLISMGAIDFGIIVDSAVVIIENLLRLLEDKKNKIRSLPATIVEAVSQMGRPILFSKAILLTAFIPLYTLQRVEGKIFRPMALTLTFALIVGTILAFTLVPVLASFAMKNKIAQHESWTVRWLLRLYRPALGWALAARKRVLMITGIASLVALVAALGLQAKLQIGWPGWLFVKIACWLVLSALAGIGYRKRESVQALIYIALAAVVVAVLMVYLKPSF